MTRSSLIEQRKKDRIPHLSFDLDGDGFVGGKDFVIGKRFDRGDKNYLTPEERLEAL